MKKKRKKKKHSQKRHRASLYQLTPQHIDQSPRLVAQKKTPPVAANPTRW